MQRLEGWFWRLLGVVEKVLNKLLLIRPSHAACAECGWVYPRSDLSDGLCPKCIAWVEFEEQERERYEWEHNVSELARQERERQIQEGIDAAWAEERQRRREEIEKDFREAQSQGLL